MSLPVPIGSSFDESQCLHGLSFQVVVHYGLAMGVGKCLYSAVFGQVGLCVWWGRRVKRGVLPSLGGGGDVLLSQGCGWTPELPAC